MGGAPREYHWVRNGLVWGVVMALLTEVVRPWYQDEPITLHGILISLFFWSAAGYAFGWLGRHLARRKRG